MAWEIDKHTYILRYHLACDPTYTEEEFYRRGDEVIDYCLKNKIEALMLYVDLNPNWYYLSDSLEHTKYYVNLIKPVIEKIRENNISFQLNYQNLVGSWDGGMDMRHVNDWEFWVSEFGLESKGVACCIGEKFRKIAGEKLKLWAETKPDVIWIDDDTGFHNHITTIHKVATGEMPGVIMEFGCFCDNHMKLFNKTYHMNLTRDELVCGIKEGGILRKMWMEFSKNCANEFMHWIEETVHAVSPETRTAIMTSHPDSHSIEGREWNGYLSNLSGKYKPLMRPAFGPYRESDPHVFYLSYLLAEQIKADVKSQYGTNVDFCPEIENTRFTIWSKSMSATKFQMMLSSYLGCRGVTLSIFDLEGSRPTEMPEFGEALLEMKPIGDKLSKYNLWNMESEGVTLITAPDRMGDVDKKVNNIIDIGSGRNWDTVIIKMGIPCKYVTPDEIKDADAFLVDAQVVNLLKDDEIKEILSKNVFLDASGAKKLEERGFLEYLGVKVHEKMPCYTNCEILHTCKHDDGSVVRIPLRISVNSWRKVELLGALELTTFLTPDGSGYTGLSRYINKLGGKVYCYATDGSFGDGFYSDFRTKLMKEVCQDLTGNGIVEVNNKSYALVASKRNDKERMILVTNMTADNVKNVEIKNPETVSKAQAFSQTGEKLETEIFGNTIKCKNTNLGLYNSIVCRVEF